jgi:hypothetical protein
MTSKDKRKPRGRPFVKGRSGNPSGRPKALAEIVSLCRQHSVEAVRRIVELIGSDDERVSLAACQYLLDRGYGKPKESVVLEEKSVPGHEDPRLRAIIDALPADALRKLEEACEAMMVSEAAKLIDLSPQESGAALS